MNVTREVITDLLPVYFSGEASADTVAMVEEFFRQDPEFAHLARRMSDVREKLVRDVPAPEAIVEKTALQKTREMVQTRNLWLAFALAYTVVPIFVYRTRVAHIFFFFAACCWVAYLFYYVKLRRSAW